MLTASDVNSWFVPQVAVKSSAQTVSNSITKVNDTALFLPMAANATYILDMLLWYEGAALNTGDLRINFALPASTNYNFQVLGFNTSGVSLEQASFQTGAGDIFLGTGGAGSNKGVTVKGVFAVSSTSGNIQLQWAQVTANATTVTTVHAQSYMTLWRVG